MISNEKGFSLASVLVAAGLLGMLAMGAAQLFDLISDGKIRSEGYLEEFQLQQDIALYLSDQDRCRISLAGSGPEGEPADPVTFNKIDVDEEASGLDIEIWNHEATDKEVRSNKRISAIDENYNKFGKLNITSLKLVFNNSPGVNYLESSSHSDIATVILNYNKKVSKKRTFEIRREFSVNVSMRTDHSGETTLLGCSQRTESLDSEKICTEVMGGTWFPTKNPPCALSRYYLETQNHSKCKNSSFDYSITCAEGSVPESDSSVCKEHSCYSSNDSRCFGSSVSEVTHAFSISGNVISCKGTTSSGGGGSCRSRQFILSTKCVYPIPSHEVEN